jgi:hypothetical protein
MQATVALQQDELTALIAKIKGNSLAELEYSETLSQCLYRRSVDDLDLDRARSLWRDLRVERAERAERANPTPGTCFHCLQPTLSDSIEHIHCREGFTVNEFNRTYKDSF